MKSAIALVCVVLFTACAQPAGSGTAPAEPARITSDAAHKLVSEGARLVDVRTPEEFAAAHVDGAMNFPLQELESRLKDLEPKSTVLVLYCRSGNRSGKAAKLLRASGFTAVHDLGAMSSW